MHKHVSEDSTFQVVIAENAVAELLIVMQKIGRLREVLRETTREKATRSTKSRVN